MVLLFVLLNYSLSSDSDLGTIKQRFDRMRLCFLDF